MVSLSALWRGATYYIHIFSQRYNNKFEIIDQNQQLNEPQDNINENKETKNEWNINNPENKTTVFLTYVV